MLLVLQSPLQNCSVLTLFIFMMQTCQVFLGSVAWFMASCFFTLNCILFPNWKLIAKSVFWYSSYNHQNPEQKILFFLVESNLGSWIFLWTKNTCYIFGLWFCIVIYLSVKLFPYKQSQMSFGCLQRHFMLYCLDTFCLFITVYMYLDTIIRAQKHLLPLMQDSWGTSWDWFSSHL